MEKPGLLESCICTCDEGEINLAFLSFLWPRVPGWCGERAGELQGGGPPGASCHQLSRYERTNPVEPDLDQSAAHANQLNVKVAFGIELSQLNCRTRAYCGLFSQLLYFSCAKCYAHILPSYVL